MNLPDISAEMRHKLSAITVVALDVDGVLTDSGMYYGPQGEMLKKFSSRDGKAIELLQAGGLLVAFITGERSESVQRRAEKLGVREVHMGITDKVAAARELLARHGRTWPNLLFVGDDWQDMPLLRHSGFSCCPAAALPPLQELVDYVAQRRGGDGVVGELLLLLSSAQPSLATLLRRVGAGSPD